MGRLDLLDVYRDEDYSQEYPQVHIGSHAPIVSAPGGAAIASPGLPSSLEDCLSSPTAWGEHFFDEHAEGEFCRYCGLECNSEAVEHPLRAGEARDESPPATATEPQDA